MHIRIIGVGSEQGDDAAGLAVAQHLRGRALPDRVELVACERPGLDLIEKMTGVDAVVIVDAMQSGRPEGTVRRIPIDTLEARRGFSSHDLGVAEALALAKTLDRLPDHIEVIGIEGCTHEGQMSAVVAKGVETAAAQVLLVIDELQHDQSVRQPSLQEKNRPTIR